MSKSAVQHLRSRVDPLLPKQLTDAELLRLALACATRHPTDLVRVLFGFRLCKELRGVDTKAIAITPVEFGALFGLKGVWPPNEAAALGVERLSSHSDVVNALTEAMRTSLSADHLQQAWTRPTVRCAVAFSLRMIQQSDALDAVVGQLTRNDARRVEALRYTLVENEVSDDVHLAVSTEEIVALTGTARERSA